MRAGNDNERRFGGPTFTIVDLSYCDKSGHKESSTTNKKLLITCMAACVFHAVKPFLTAKNTSEVEIHRQLPEVYGSDIRSVQMVRKWCREFRKERCEVHDELHTGRSKVVTDKSVNRIRMLLNEDHRLTL